MHKVFLLIGSLTGAVAVLLGAFGAHGLKKILPPESVATFETGVRYQFYHTFALLLVALVYEKYAGKLLVWSGNCFITGIVLFSGSLYLLAALNDTSMVGLRKIGIITPFGGLSFFAGWLLLAWAVWRK